MGGRKAGRRDHRKSAGLSGSLTGVRLSFKVIRQLRTIAAPEEAVPDPEDGKKEERGEDRHVERMEEDDLFHVPPRSVEKQREQHLQS